MILLIAAAALAMDPPSHKLLDDLDRWESGMDIVMAGPQGCWDFTGEVHQTMTFHQPPDLYSSARIREFTGKGTFKAHLNNGIWDEIEQEMQQTVDGKSIASISSSKSMLGEMTRDEEFKEEMNQEEDEDFEIPVIPLIGEVRNDDADEEDIEDFNKFLGKEDSDSPPFSPAKSVNLLRQAVDEWAGRTETAVAQWDKEQQAVVLMREIPVTDDDERTIHVDVRFPEAGKHADRIDAVWPRIVKVGKWPFKVTIRDAQMHVLSYQYQGMSLPRAESLSVVIGILGYTFAFEQTLQFTTAARCTAPAIQDE